MKSGQQLYRWSLVSVDGQPVRSSSGLEVSADCALDALVCPDILFVMPSYQYRLYESPVVLARLRQFARQAVPLGGLDCGAHMLAAAGLLDHYRATIHWEELGLFEERFLDVVVSRDRYVIDRDRITAGGGTTALDLMLHLIRRDAGERLANDVAGVFIYDHERASHDPQWVNPAGSLAKRDPRLRDALEIMMDHVEDPLSIVDLARRVGVSQRDLERLFKKMLKTSPHRYYQHMRLTRAQSLLLESDLTMPEIAARTGYHSSVSFARAFKAHYGIPPRSLRVMR